MSDAVWYTIAVIWLSTGVGAYKNATGYYGYFWATVATGIIILLNK